MADILIRGMEMPKTCSQCPMCYDYMMCKLNKFAFWNTNEPFDCCDERLAGCPLHELPEHGDLIEAEPIKKFITDGLNSGEFGHDTIEVLTEVEYAPVIVPASEEAQDD